jgi:hypothetical protein
MKRAARRTATWHLWPRVIEKLQKSAAAVKVAQWRSKDKFLLEKTPNLAKLSPSPV